MRLASVESCWLTRKMARSLRAGGDGVAGLVRGFSE